MRAHLGPRHRDHLHGGVQLHGAAAQRDHAVRERQVAALQRPDVPQHLRLAVVAVEHRVREDVALSAEAVRDPRVQSVQQLVHAKAERRAAVEGQQDLLHVLHAGGLVQRDADGGLVVAAQVDAAVARRGQDAAHPRADVDAHGVEEGAVDHPVVQPLRAGRQQLRQRVDALRDGAQPVGPVVDGVHPRHHRQQHLRRADVAGRLFAADVLLARLQRHAQRGVAVGVHAHADDAAGDLALVLVAAAEERGVRPAEAHRHAEALGGAHAHVRAPLARRGEQDEREQVRRGDHDDPLLARPLRERPVVRHLAVGGGILQQRAEDGLREVELLQVAHDDVDAAGPGAGADHVDGLRMAEGGDEEGVPGLAAGDAVRHGHGLGRGGALVQQRRVGDGQAGQVDDGRLEVEQRLQPPLRDLGLVGRVLRVPARVLQDVALDDGRGDAVVVAHPQAAAEHAVARHQGPQLAQQLVLAALRAQRQRPLQADGAGDGGVHQRVQRLVADGLQHPPDLGVVGTHVPANERVRMGKCRSIHDLRLLQRGL